MSKRDFTRSCRKCTAKGVDKAGLCRDCGREAVQKYREAHPQKVAEQNRKRDWAAYREANREAIRANARKWARLNKDRIRDYQYRRRYGVGIEEYHRLLVSQNGACAICRKIKKRRLHVDHEHGSGVVRGLLCDYCNRRLGYLGDTLEEFRATMKLFEDYLLHATSAARKADDKPDSGQIPKAS